CRQISGPGPIFNLIQRNGTEKTLCGNTFRHISVLLGRYSRRGVPLWSPADATDIFLHQGYAPTGRWEQSLINKASGIDLTGTLGSPLACRPKSEPKSQHGGWGFCLFLWHRIGYNGFTDRE